VDSGVSHGESFATVLSGNMSHWSRIAKIACPRSCQANGGTVVGYHVSNAGSAALWHFDYAGQVSTISQAPDVSLPDCAVTALLLLDGDAPHRERQATLSAQAQSGYPKKISYNCGRIDDETLGRHASAFQKIAHRTYLSNLTSGRV
jgi:dTDP-glucose pyrophosphorylase